LPYERHARVAAIALPLREISALTTRTGVEGGMQLLTVGESTSL